MNRTLKATLAAFALALPMMLAPAAEARGLWSRHWTANQVRIEQTGRNNAAAAVQNGRANDITINQAGRDNLTQVTQNGNNNGVRVDQVGSANTAIINQSNNNNSAALYQYGNGLGAEINQTGNQCDAVLQTARGVAVLPNGGFLARCR